MAEFSKICELLWQDDTFRGLLGAAIILTIVYVTVLIIDDASNAAEGEE